MANPARFDKLIRFGQSLQAMLQDMQDARVLVGRDLELSTKILQDAFSLLAYADPWSSPVGWQLEQVERERVSSVLNSAILDGKNLPPLPPLEVGLSHTRRLLKIMGENEIGASAFATITDFVN